MFYSGFGVPQDYVQAAHWFRTAANLGDPTAQHLHLDYVSADAWYSRALENGDRSAEPRLKALSSRR